MTKNTQLPERERRALAAYCRLIVLAEAGIGPRSEVGKGQRRWRRASDRIRSLKGDLNLGEYTEFCAWAHERLGHVYEQRNRVWQWFIPDSKARQRKHARRELTQIIAAERREVIAPWSCPSYP